jgi:hypothetical protein
MGEVVDVQTNTICAWDYLFEHPRLQWVPPVWRGRVEIDPHHIAHFVIRSVERNLVVRIGASDGKVTYILHTGPLHDLRRNGKVDPVTPAMEIDERLCGTGATFDAALWSLARAVQTVYDDPNVGSTRAYADDKPAGSSSAPTSSFLGSNLSVQAD